MNVQLFKVIEQSIIFYVYLSNSSILIMKNMTYKQTVDNSTIQKSTSN